jgi:zinc transport system substrate-binding protein
MQHYNITFKVFWLPLTCVLFCLSALAYSDANDKPLVVTSIKPLAIIARSALQDRARVEYLMPSGLSPHDIVLKVSDIRTLAKADLVLWIGSDFEIRAAKQFAALPASKLITAMDVIFPEHKTGETEDNGEHKVHEEHEEHEEHDHDIDPHIWLSPTIANQLAKILSSRLDLPVVDIFSEELRKDTLNLLAPVIDRNYMVHHQGHGYFVDEFELQPGLSIRDMLGKQKGAKTQFNLRLEGQKLGVSCVFTEPQHSDKDAVAMAKDLSVATTTIDILAVAYDDQLPSYESYIYGLATQFSACFK